MPFVAMRTPLRDGVNFIWRKYSPRIAFLGCAFQNDSLNFFQANYKFVFNRHAAASTKSPTVQKSLSIPAAIAGVARSLMWRFTKL